MTTTDNVATEFFALKRQGDVEGAMALCTADFTWTVTGRSGGFAMAGTYDQEEYLEMLGRVGRTFDQGPTIEFLSCTVGEGHIVIEARVRGRSAAGVDYDNDLAYVFDIVGGKIAAVREYLDTMHAQPVFGPAGTGDPNRGARRSNLR